MVDSTEGPIDYRQLTCGGCLHYRDPADGASTGSCWLEPPVPVSIPMQQPPPGIAIPKNTAAAQGSTGIMTFPTRPPVTDKTPACGQWEPADLPGYRQGGPRDTPELDA